jgi:hypothetical protein
MADTKIINVLKNDSFEEVFRDFQNTDAEEVIFMFPKGSKFKKNEQYFEILAKEASNSGKSVSVMTSDPAIAEFAINSGMQVVEEKAKNKRGRASTKAKPKPLPIIPAHELIEEDKEESEESVDHDEAIEDFMASGKDRTPELVKVEAEEEDSDETESEEEDEEGTSQYGVITPRGATLEQDEDIDQPITHGEDGVREYSDVILAGQKYSQRHMKDILAKQDDKNIEVDNKDTEESEEVFLRVKPNKNFDKDIKSIWADKSEQATYTREEQKKVRPPRNWKRRLPLLFVSATVITTAGLLYALVGNAQIGIKPIKENINFQIKLNASSEVSNVSADFTVIPGQKLSAKDQVSGSFVPSDQKEIVQKAHGKVIISNKSTTSQRLVATTRLENETGLIYRIPNSITVPGATVKNGTITAGTVVVDVYADKPGLTYNITSGNFTIPGFKDTDKYGDFAAETKEAITGGANGQSKVVSEKDYTDALKNLKDQLTGKINQSLKDQSNGLQTIASSQIQFDDPVANARSGEATDQLQVSIKGAVDTIGFRNSDLQSVIKNYVNKNSNLDPVMNTLSISFQNISLASDKKSLAFTIVVNGKAVHHLDTTKISKDILGMNQAALQNYFKNIKDIESTKINFSPFWVTSIPEDVKKVKIDLEI